MSLAPSDLQQQRAALGVPSLLLQSQQSVGVSGLSPTLMSPRSFTVTPGRCGFAWELLSFAGQGQTLCVPPPAGLPGTGTLGVGEILLLEKSPRFEVGQK